MTIDRKWLALAVVGSGTFMSALDTSIVNIALPTIAKQTGAALSTIEWVVLIYLITVSSTLLTFGRLADIYGRRGIYIAGQAFFTGGSLLCAISPGIAVLIGSRMVQGLGAAMVFALGPAVLIGAFPQQERGRALGLQATMTYLGMSLGPTLGGLLTERFGWPSIFWVNVPIGCLAIALSRRALDRSARGESQPFDRLGAGLMAVALSTFLFALSKGQDWGWGNPSIVALLAIAAIAWPSLILVELRQEYPALDLRLFRDRTFSASTLAAVLCYLATAGLNFVMPFFLIRAVGLPESRAGLVLSCTPVMMMCLTGFSGGLSDRIGVRIPSTAGMALMAAGAGWLATLGMNTAPASVAVGAALVGIGVGMFTAPNNSAIMGSAPPERRGVAGAVLAAARTVGFASGVVSVGLVYSLRLGGTDSRPAITSAVHAGLWVIVSVCLLASALSAFGRARI